MNRISVIVGIAFGVAFTNVGWMLETAIKYGGASAYGCVIWAFIAGISGLGAHIIAVNESEKD